MAANLSQAFLDGAGVVSSLVQELASGNFSEGRDSFHDYIYSKLFHTDEKGNIPSESKPNASVFLSPDLTSGSSNQLAVLNSPYIHGPTNSSHSTVESGSDETSKIQKNLSLMKSLTDRKSDGSKKKLKIPNLQPDVVLQASAGNSEGQSKKRKKSQYKKKEKSHVCDVCGRGFAEKYTLNRHMLTHTHIKPYSCSKCNMSFSRSDGLAKHMAAGHRRVDAHHCDVCGGTFNSELSFEQHRREYGNTLPFVCNLCMLAFSQCCHLNYHMKSHSLSKMNDNFGFDGQDDKNNIIDVSELIPEDFSPPKKEQNKTSSGGIVDNSFERASKGLHSLNMLGLNVAIKPEIEDFSIMTSTASSSVANSLVNHAENNLGEGNSVSTSSYLPDTSKSLSNTNMVVDPEMKKYYNIKIPNPKFLENSVLSMATMGEDGLFRCGVCGKGFTRKYHMQRHVKLHTRGPVPRAHLLDWTRRPYACGVCKMGFTRQHHLTRHILIHTGERPHSCHICGRAFRRYTNLSLHIRTVHEAERPFKCNICGRSFPRLYSLQRHLKLHAKNAAFTLSAAGNDDQLYKGFKAVGIVNVENRQSPVYNQSADSSAVQQSSGSNQEHVESAPRDDSEEYKQESNPQGDNLRHIEPPGCSGNPRVGQESYSFMQDGNHICFQSRSDQHIQIKDQARGSLPGQTEDTHTQTGLMHPQVISPPESDNRVQQNRRVSSDIDDIKLQNSVRTLSSTEFDSQSHHTEVAGMSHRSLQSRNITDFNLQQTTPSTNEDRLISAASLNSQNIPMLNISAGGNFHDLGITETGNYQRQRDSSGGDGFTILQQQIQSPLPMMTMLERPGSRSMMNQTPHLDAYHHPSTGYTQPLPSLQIQQRSNINLPTTRKTTSPATMQEHGNYSHNNLVDIGAHQGGIISDPAVYSHNHNVNSMPFQFSNHGMYQRLLSDSLTQMDIHPHPSSSPMPVISHNNVQY